MQLGAGQATPTRLAIERPTDKGRLLTIVTDQPILFLGAGVPGAKPKEGYDFAIIDLEVDAKGTGSGTLAPAAKVTVKDGRLRRRGLRGGAGAIDCGQEGEVARDAPWPATSFDTTATFQLAIEASPAGVLVTDAEGTIHLVNAELERQFGYTRDELVGRSVDLLVPEALQSVEQVHRQSFTNAPHARPMGAGPALTGRRKDGSTIAVEISLKPIQTADGRFVLATVIDVSERRGTAGRDNARPSRRQLEFERFVAELSFQFINLPGDEVIDGIRHGLAPNQSGVHSRPMRVLER